MPYYKRILIKISGEALAGKKGYGISLTSINNIVKQIVELHNMGLEICIVVGAGNIFRGEKGTKQGISRCTADHMGMLGTVFNSLVVHDAFINFGIDARVMSSVSMRFFCEEYIFKKALCYLNKRKVLIFAAGAGLTHFSTDTVSILRALEMKCDIVMKGTNVDGVYSKDPKKYMDAVFYPSINYSQVLLDNLKVIDATAISLARENNMPILVFSINEENALLNVIKKSGKCSLITQEGVKKWKS